MQGLPGRYRPISLQKSRDGWVQLFQGRQAPDEKTRDGPRDRVLRPQPRGDVSERRFLLTPFPRRFLASPNFRLLQQNFRNKGRLRVRDSTVRRGLSKAERC